MTIPGILVLLILLLQRTTAERCLKALAEDHRLTVSAAEPDQPFTLVITLTNRSFFFLPFIRFQETLPAGLSLTEEIPDRQRICGTAWLLPGQKRSFSFSVCGNARGCFRLMNLTVSCGDFLGLDEEFRQYNPFREVVIYPREAGETDVNRLPGSLWGDLSVRRFLYEDPVLTMGFREYSGREPMKSISWTQTARLGHLMVKEYDHTADYSVSVILDTAHAADPEALDQACSLARSVCRKLNEMKIPYDFRMNARTAGLPDPEGRTNTHGRSRENAREGLGGRHFRGILELLGRALPDVSEPCLSLLHRTVLASPTGHGVLLLTSGLTPEERTAAYADARGRGIELTVLTVKE